MKQGKNWLVALFLCVKVVSSSLVKGVEVLQTDVRTVVDNGFVKAVFNQEGSIFMSELYGDFQGSSNYGTNLLANMGFRLERENADGSVTFASFGSSTSGKATVIRTEECCDVSFPSVFDDSEVPVVEEQWLFSLCAGDRSLRFQSTGKVVAADTTYKFRTISHSLYANPLSTTAFFDQGVVQIMSAQPKNTAFGSIDRMHRAFVLGGMGAIDVLRPQATGGEHDQVVLLNAVPHEGAYTSGFREILLGTFTERDVWCAGSSDADVQVRIFTEHKMLLHPQIVS